MVLGWLHTCHNAEIVSRINIRYEAVFSQVSVRISGQRPAEFSVKVRMETGIRMLVSGSARRLVSMKYTGNDLKWKYASGPVVSWQDMVSDAASHISFSRWPPSLSVHMPFRWGCMYAMPAIAA